MPTNPCPTPCPTPCPNGCCAALAAIRESRRARDRRQYHKDIKGSRAKALAAYHNRKTKPPGVNLSGPLEPPADPT